MKLSEYLVASNLTQKDFLDRFGHPRPTKQCISRIVNEEDTPGLELALLICSAANGSVQLHDLLVDRKRKYTEAGDPIYVAPSVAVDDIL